MTSVQRDLEAVAAEHRFGYGWVRGVLALALAVIGLGAVAWAGETAVHVLSATVKDQPIRDAEVILQKNGEASVKATTDSSGHVKFANPFGGADDVTVTMIIKKDGYSNLVVKCPCAGLTYALSPVMQSLDGMRVVLNWGANPKDLDSHLVFPHNHVFFNHQKGDAANLDVDCVEGFGPETITLQKKKAAVKYLYAVHNYSEGERTGTVSLSNTSRAKVFVYIGASLVRTFTPPKGKAGNVWVVFGIGENGEFYDINRFTDVGSREAVGDVLSGIIAKEGFLSIPEVSVDQKKLAEELNKAGEQAYHQKKLEDAVSLYLEAINNNPEHGQAYSNLGLAYQKLNRSAEALWANRKAIALASGANKETIQASSFYNIGRVYEEQQQWQDALLNYQQAENHKTNAVYQKAIDRVKSKVH